MVKRPGSSEALVDKGHELRSMLSELEGLEPAVSAAVLQRFGAHLRAARQKAPRGAGLAMAAVGTDKVHSLRDQLR